MRNGRITAIFMAVMLSVCSCKSEVPLLEAPTEVEQPSSNAVSSIVRETTLGPVHVVVRLTPEKPVIGDPVTLTLEADSEDGVRVDMPEFGDQLGRFNISSFRHSQDKRADGRNYQKLVYALDLPMSGKLRLPSFLIEFVDDRATAEASVCGKLQEILTEEVSFEVASVLQEDSVAKPLQPLKDELDELVLPEVAHKDSSMVWWIACLFVLLLWGVGTGGYLYWRKRRVKFTLPPHEIALQALQDLSRKGMPNSDEEIDHWYVTLSDILRNYVEGRYSLHAPRLTTEEFFELAKSSDALNASEKARVCDLLTRSDRVKFASFHPSNAENEDMFNSTRQFVEETRPVEIQPVEEHKK